MILILHLSYWIENSGGLSGGQDKNNYSNQRIYLVLIRILGIALLIFSLIFLYDGIKYL